MRDRPISPGSPWQNPCVERLLALCVASAWTGCWPSARRTWQILSSYTAYYNEVRTHLAWAKMRPWTGQFNGSATLSPSPILSGLPLRPDIIFGK
jgi:hypothetical protein